MDVLSDLDEAELAGDHQLAAVVEEIRAYAIGPAPAARPALMAVLTEGLAGHPDLAPAAPAPVASRRRWAERLQTARARLALGTAVASVSFLATGAAGALPGPAQSAFEQAASVVGIDLPEQESGGNAAPGPSAGTSDAPAGPAVQEHHDGVASARSESSASLDDRRRGSVGPQEGPPMGPAAAHSRSIHPGGELGDTGSRGLPSPAQAPDVPGGGRGAPEGDPRAPAPAPPGLFDPGRPDGVSNGAGEDDDDEQRSPRPGVPAGKLPGRAGNGPAAPAPPGHDEVPRQR